MTRECAGPGCSMLGHLVPPYKCRHLYHSRHVFICRSEAQELRCAKEFLEQHLDRHVVAMIGHSKGATDVLLYAAQFDDVPCIVNLAARFEVQKGVLERLGPDVLQQLEQNGKVCKSSIGKSWRVVVALSEVVSS